MQSDPWGLQPAQEEDEPTATSGRCSSTIHEQSFLVTREELREAAEVLGLLQQDFRDRWTAVGWRSGFRSYGMDAERICVTEEELSVSDGLRQSRKIKPTKPLRYQVLRDWLAAQSTYPFTDLSAVQILAQKPPHAALSAITTTYLQRTQNNVS